MTIAVCSDCGAVVAAGPPLGETWHGHADLVDYPCSTIDVLGETHPTTYPTTTATGEQVADADAFLEYLQRYVGA